MSEVEQVVVETKVGWSDHVRSHVIRTLDILWIKLGNKEEFDWT